MHPTIRAIMLLAGIWMAFPSQAVEPFTITDIHLEGLQRISAGTVFSYLPLKVGDRVDNRSAAAAMHALFKAGFFKDIRLEREGSVLVVWVREHPAVATIKFNGNKDVDDEQLTEAMKQLGLAEGRVFERLLLDRAEQELQRLYHSQGKYAAKIESTVTPLERNRVGVEIDISEGKAARIREIRLVGNQAFGDKQLLKLMQLGTTGWLSWLTKNDQYSKPKLAADQETLRSFYLDRGYLNFNIDSAQVALTPDKQGVYITINITEGEKYRVKEVGLAGEMVVPKSELEPLLQIEPGSTFSRRRLTEASERLTRRLGQAGYAFANVNPIPDVVEETREVGLTFFIDPGKRVYVRRINFSGNTKTSDEVLRRELRQMEAAPFDTDKIAESKERLDRLGYFEEVNVETPAVPGSTDQVDANVTVVEKPSGNILAGVGFSQTGGVSFNGSINQENFMGTGKRVSLAFDTSKLRTLYNFGYTNPYWTIDGVSRGFDLFYRTIDAEQANLADYGLNTLGGKVSFGVPINESDRFSFGLAVDRNDIDTTGSTPTRFVDYLDDNGLIKNPEECLAEDSSPGDCRTNAFDQFKLILGWSRDTRNRAIFPDRGSLYSLRAQVAVPGSDLEYYKLDYSQRLYQPLWFDYILLLKGNLGYGDDYGDTHGMPFFENFYAGGIRTVRGYKDNTLGPRDPETGDPIGGSFRTVGNVELIAPLFKDKRSVRISGFFDAGTVFDTPSSASFKSLRYSAGAGVNWLSPLGALYFSLAYPINPGSDDETQVFQFSLGSNF
jgi:outer membrane protein insertion porin family